MFLLENHGIHLLDGSHHTVFINTLEVRLQSGLIEKRYGNWLLLRAWIPTTDGIIRPVEYQTQDQSIDCRVSRSFIEADADLFYDVLMRKE